LEDVEETTELCGHNPAIGRVEQLAAIGRAQTPFVARCKERMAVEAERVIQRE
jgi:hypothetical protein